MERHTVTIKNINDIQRYVAIDDLQNLHGSTPNFLLDESNDALLYPDLDASSCSSTDYKDIQDSIKIPFEVQSFVAGQKLSESDDSENENADGTDIILEEERPLESNHSENEYVEGMDIVFKDEKLLESYSELSDFEEETPVVAIRSYSSLEALSSISNDFYLDINEIENLMPNCESSESAFSINELISALPIDDQIFNSHLPPVNRDSSATVPLQSIDKNFEGKIVYIAEIFDPAHFWFQFVAGDENFEHFGEFHEKINSDYNKLRDKELMISDENFAQGLIVAVYVDKFQHWYRAKIVDNYNNEKSYVRLFFIDYGTNGISSKKKIRYLFQYFLKYPQYCFRGRIHGIVPFANSRSFEMKQIEAFIMKISNHSLNADVVKHEPEEDVYQLNLVRRRDEINIRDFLLEKNFCAMMDPWQNDGEFSIGPPCYLIPTFEALERDYPTYAYLEKMKRSGINYDLVVDTNHFHSVKRDDVENNMEMQIIVQSPQFSMTKKYFYGYT